MRTGPADPLAVRSGVVTPLTARIFRGREGYPLSRENHRAPVLCVAVLCPGREDAPTLEMRGSGIFTVSIDVELAWGHRRLLPRILYSIPRERGVVRSLLDLFRTYDIRATWAVVGHLLLDSCEPDCGELHPHVRGAPRSDARFPSRAGEHARRGNPMWWGRDIIEQVRTASPTQEIASHSFSHVFYDERTTRPDTVRIDIEKSRQAHHSFGLPFQAFVFPNNKVGYKTLLADAGILTYRSPSPKWFDRVPSGALWSLFNFMHFVLAVPPAPGAATVDETGMVNIPASMLLLARHGLRRIVSSRNLVKMGVGGLDRAVEQAAIFHLWFHLSNFTYMTEAQLAVLEAILRHTQRLREAGSLEVLTMTDIQRRVVSIALRNDAGAATQPSEGRR